MGEEIQIADGVLQGVTDAAGIRSFKGIPFAAPPVGDLRWKAPQPVKAWEGVRKADAFAPAPMQDGMMAQMLGVVGGFSEDCLYLNVWTPAKTADAKLPVMVWIYGGAYIGGMSSARVYDGTRLASRGVVLVSIAYRVGAFGFLAHPDLSRESGKGSGCFGIQDQIAALRWVRENIEQFGGDPSNVTIFGESAGGISVSIMTVAPAAKGLFQRAIAESGASMGPLKVAHEAGQNVRTLRAAEQVGVEFLAKLGVKEIAAARALSAEKIRDAGAPLRMFWPVADGETIPGDQYRLFEQGQFNDTPILIGTNSDEGAMFVKPPVTPEEFEQRTRERFGPAAERILQVYPQATEAEAFKASKDVFREAGFAWHAWSWAKLQARHGRSKAFVYYFDHRAPSSLQGSNHADEVPYVFGNLGRSSGPRDRALSDMIGSFWVNFAKTGDPNGDSLPGWPAFDETRMSALIFDETPGARTLPNLEQLAAFDEYFKWRRSAT